MSPTTEEQLREADLLLKLRQARWETPKAVAMIALAVAALAATSHLVDFLNPPRTQTITVRLEQPLKLPP